MVPFVLYAKRGSEETSSFLSMVVVEMWLILERSDICRGQSYFKSLVRLLMLQFLQGRSRFSRLCIASIRFRLHMVLVYYQSPFSPRRCIFASDFSCHQFLTVPDLSWQSDRDLRQRASENSTILSIMAFIGVCVMLFLILS